MPATNNTPTQLAQFALNAAVALQNQIITGQTEVPSKGQVQTVLGICALLAEALLVLNSTANTGGGTIPNTLLTGKYSVTVPSTTNVQV